MRSNLGLLRGIEPSPGSIGGIEPDCITLSVGMVLLAGNGLILGAVDLSFLEDLSL